MNTEQVAKFVNHCWDTSIVPQLIEYIRIPNKSPMFDPNWRANGYMDQAVELMVRWCKEQRVASMTVEVVRLPQRTPLIFIDVPGRGESIVLLYGHLDKQPEMTGWRDGFGPWIPVIEDDKLYGRGGADDGYAVFGSLAAIMALKEQNIPHASLKIVIEAGEESGSPDLPAYMQHLRDRIGSPDLVICLDSGCGNYDQLWYTTSLRGVIGGTLRVDVLEEGVHSGDAGGIVPSSFGVLRQLLNRVEDASDGKILLPQLHVEIPAKRAEQAKHAAHVLGEMVHDKMGEGGTIPFMAMLGEQFPDAQFLITGVLGPQSNAHGPNEFLHIPTGKRATACVAQIIADHFQAHS